MDFSLPRVRSAILILSALALAACSGRGDDGGGEPQPQPQPQPTPAQLSIGIVSVAEGNSGVSNFVLTVTSSVAASSSLTASFTTTDGTATAGSDYTASSGTLTIAAGSTTANVTIAVNGDTVVEADETFTVTLSNVSAAATLGTASAVVTIINDDVQPVALGAGLNDTGATTCTNGVNLGLDCNSAAVGTNVFPGQDAEHGRDVTANTAADGHAGFSFTKLDANGVPLADQSLAFSALPWQCVLDNVTGLVWEVKTDDNGLRDKDWRYSWFDSSRVADGGYPGRENLGVCANTSDCDTEKYRDAVNAVALCARTDWRLPARSELLSIVHFGSGSAPFIDGNFFPQSLNGGYWSGSVRGNDAWSISLLTAGISLISRDAVRAARLVSDGGGL